MYFKIKNINIDLDFEIISLILSPNPKLEVSLIACYRSPKQEIEDPFLAKLEQKVLEMGPHSTETIILGDLNFDQFDVKGKGRKLADFNNTHGFSSTNTKKDSESHQ